MSNEKNIFLQNSIRKIAHLLIRTGMKIQSIVSPGENLTGDREIEWSWVLAKLQNSKHGKALDLGPGRNLYLSITAALRGYDVTALDREEYNYSFVPENLLLKKGDILTEDITPDSLNMIICCSVVEHIGLRGRYHVINDVPDGDIIAMQKLHQALKKDGYMIFTIPVGVDAVFAPNHRVYGGVRLPVILGGWDIVEECYWVKSKNNVWMTVSREKAISQPASFISYGIGCFVLKKGKYTT